MGLAATVTDFNVGGTIASRAVFVVAPRVALIVAYWRTSTGETVIANDCFVALDTTFTDAGTVATALLLDRATTTPLGPAAPVRVTVPPVLIPLTTEPALVATLAKSG